MLTRPTEHSIKKPDAVIIETKCVGMCLIKRKLKIKFIPSLIANLHIGDSSWFDGYNERYFIGRGAAFAALKTPITLFFVIQFAIRKYRLYHENISIFKAISLMRKGVKQYRKEQRCDK